MISRYQAICILVVILLFLIGCSGGGHDTPVDPGTGGDPELTQPVRDAGDHNRLLLGYWDVALNSGTGEFETVLLRQAVFHINVIQHMQDVANLFIEMLYENYDTGEFHLDVRLTHPFPNTDLRGFDVRGIVFGSGPEILSSKDDPDLMWFSPDGFRLLNEDGWTRWWNPSEFTTPGLFGYTDGKFGTQNGDFPTTLNPYKYFASVLDATDPVVPLVDASNRGTFATDEGPATRRYELRFPMLGGFPDARFQYAIDASWAPPTGGGSIPGIDDFPPEANCPEAFHIVVDASDSNAFYDENSGFYGGDINLNIEVYDWGALYNPSGVIPEIGNIKLESSMLFNDVLDIPLDYEPGASNLSGKYHLTIPDVHPTGFTDQEVLVHVLSGGMESYQPPVAGHDYPSGEVLTAYTMATMPIDVFDPTLAGNFESTGAAIDVLTAGNLCHVLDSIDGLVFANVADLENIIELNSVTLPGVPAAFDVGNGYAFIIDNSANLVRIVDISPVGSANLLGNTVPITGTPTSIDVDGNYAYVGCQNGNLDIINISTPTSASVVNTVTASGAIMDVSVSGGYAYVATNDLEIFDVDPPGSAGLANTVATSSNVRAVDISDDGYAFLGDSSDQLLVVDVDPVGSATIVETLGLDDLVNDVECDDELTHLTVANVGVQVVYFDAGSSTAYLIGDEFLTNPDELSIDGNMGYTVNNSDIGIVELWPEDSTIGWARTWGGLGYSNGRDIAVDDSGNIYIAGIYTGTVDFDPGDGENVHTSNGATDAYFVKYDSSGNFQWAATWGASDYDYATGLAIDDMNDIYVSGYFWETVDFDPGVGVDNRTSNGIQDCFLSKFDDLGNFIWVRAWGGSASDCSISVAVDSAGDIYPIGHFYGTVDFDPGPGVDNHSPVSGSDAFLSKFDSSGNYQWVRTWGGLSTDGVQGISIDGADNIYNTGHFLSTCDFDPGPGFDTHTSNGNYDAYLSKFDTSGNWQWARTWGGIEEDAAQDIVVDQSGNPYITGLFSDTVDFDPSGSVVNQTSNGHRDVYLSRFDPSGNFTWVRVWGGVGDDEAFGATINGLGHLHVTGFFEDIVDFDPGGGIENRNSEGERDIFINTIDTSGNFQWVTVVGGIGYDSGRRVTTDQMWNIIVTGAFSNIVDFDPGTGIDYHTATGAYDSFVCKFAPDGTW